VISRVEGGDFQELRRPPLDALSRWADGLTVQGVDLAPGSAIGARILP